MVTFSNSSLSVLIFAHIFLQIPRLISSAMPVHQFSQLNEQFAILQANLEEFDGLIKDISLQYSAIQKLAVMHSSLFMASETVFGNNYNTEDDK